MDKTVIFSKLSSVVSRQVGDECIIIPLSNNIVDMDKVITLNDTAAFLWRQIDGKQTIFDIIKNLIEEYDIDESVATHDVIAFINDMQEWLVKNQN